MSDTFTLFGLIALLIAGFALMPARQPQPRRAIARMRQRHIR